MDEIISKYIYKLSPNPANAFLRKRNTIIEYDMYNIASIIFNIEKAIKKGYRIRQVIIPISELSMSSRDMIRVEEILHELLLYILLEDISIKFESISMKDLMRHKRGNILPLDECENVCLFSGGVDSYSGLLNSYAYYKEVCGVSIIHGDQKWHSFILNNLINNIKTNHEIDFHLLFAPTMGSSGYSQLRGFLYILYGGIYVKLHDSKRLIVTECGPTMYQPRFSPFDEITMTTHPYVMKSVNEIINIFLQRNIDIIIPYENMTKSEVIAASPNPDQLQNTHSCISMRFGTNEGSCYGCIVRRLGFLTANIRDTDYSSNPLIETRKVDNLLQLVRFSYDILFDYSNIPEYSKGIIHRYNKKDLFKRFALDNISALWISSNTNRRMNKYLSPLYIEAINNIDNNKMKKRIQKVRDRTFKPNFSKRV